MEGVVTILQEPHASLVKQVWEELSDSCGVKGIQAFPTPHFSWHIAHEYDRDSLWEALQVFCKSAQPFTVRTGGLGIFNGEKLVVNIALVKDKSLLDFHREVWDLCECCSSQSFPYYAPNSWMPHITLAIEDVFPENIGCVVERLVSKDFSWELSITNLALFTELEDFRNEALLRIDFGACK
jgi:2'-5' RNA ligase